MSRLVVALAALVLGAGAGAAVGPAAPAGATDDGEDISDLLVEEVDGYELQPKGDPTRGRSGPIDWEDMGGQAPGLGTDELPNDMATYVHTFFADDYSVFALVMGLDIGELDPSAVLAGATVGMGHFGGDEELVLPNADLAEVDYEARDMSDPEAADEGLTYAAAALADEDIVVLVMVSSWDGDVEEEHRVLDRFVTAQAQFEPPPDRTRSGGLGGSDEDGEAVAADDEQTAADDTPTRPVAAAPGGDDGSSRARRLGLLLSLGLLLLGLGLLIRYLVVYRFRPAAEAKAAAQAQAARAQLAAARPDWWPLAGGGGLGARRPPRTPMPSHPPMAPPEPPTLGGPPLRPTAPTAPPARPPAPVPVGGDRSGVPGAGGASGHGSGEPTGGGWRLPG